MDKDTLDNKDAILLNYGMTLNEIGGVLQDFGNFVHKFFQRSPELKQDRDLLKVGEKYRLFLEALKALDEEIEKAQITLDNKR